MPLNPAQKAEWIETLREAMQIVKSLPAVQRCADCANFDAQGGCLEFGAMPPADYQMANDCDAWDNIPF